MKKLIFVLCFAISILIPAASNAQGIANVDIIQNWNPHSFLDKIRGAMQPYDPKVLGSHYLYDQWMPADVALNLEDIELKATLVKIDVLHNVMMVKENNDSIYLPMEYVQNFKFSNDHNKVYTSHFELGEAFPAGIYELVYGDKIKLYKHYEMVLVEAHYNPALNAGSRDHLLKIKHKYCLAIEDTMVPLSMNSRKFLELFESPDLVKSYIKENDIRLKNEQDLVKTISYVNSNYNQLGELR